MPTLAEVRDMVDAFIAARQATVQTRQENYLTSNGRYWQGLRTHTIDPAHTTATDGSIVGDRLGLKPTDISSTWLDVLPEWLTELFPSCIRVDSYLGPSGHGWLLILTAAHNGITYLKVINVGPESWRARAWVQNVSGM